MRGGGFGRHRTRQRKSQMGKGLLLERLIACDCADDPQLVRGHVRGDHMIIGQGPRTPVLVVNLERQRVTLDIEVIQHPHRIGIVAGPAHHSEELITNLADDEVLPRGPRRPVPHADEPGGFDLLPWAGLFIGWIEEVAPVAGRTRAGSARSLAMDAVRGHVCGRCAGLGQHGSYGRAGASGATRVLVHGPVKVAAVGTTSPSGHRQVAGLDSGRHAILVGGAAILPDVSDGEVHFIRLQRALHERQGGGIGAIGAVDAGDMAAVDLEVIHMLCTIESGLPSAANLVRVQRPRGRCGQNAKQQHQWHFHRRRSPLRLLLQALNPSMGAGGIWRPLQFDYTGTDTPRPHRGDGICTFVGGSSMNNAPSRSRLNFCLGIVAGLFTLSGIANAQRAPAVMLGAGPFTYHTPGTDFRVDVITRGLVHPWGLAFLPDGSILVTERPGRLRIVRNGVLDPTPVAGVPSVYTVGLSGLLDIALDPNFKQNHYIYLAYSKPGPDLGPNDVPDGVRAPAAVMGPKGPGKTMRDAVARGVWNGHALTKVHDIFVDDTVLDDSVGALGQDSAIRIVFGRDGKLYIGLGAPNTPGNSGKYAHSRGGIAQDPTSDDGKVLRLNADGTVPRDNPFVGKPGYKPAIYTMGNRNILGMAVNPSTGVVWEDENGPQDDDKLIALKPGANYGWPITGIGYDYSGDHIGGPIALGDASAVNPGYLNGTLPGIEQPFLIWVPAVAPSGLAFYTGDQFPMWKGSIFVGSLKYRRLERHVRNDKGGPIRREYLLEDLKQRVRDVRQGPDGDLYVITDEDQGALMRLEPVSAQ